MNDVTQNFRLEEPWLSASSQMAQLLRTLPLSHAGPLLLVLPEAGAYGALCAAAAQLGWLVVAMPVQSEQEGVAWAIAQNKPGVVVCAPEIFGWVSKLAFLGGCLAIYTCGEEGEGTLMDRASHFSATSASKTGADIAYSVLTLDIHGVPITA